MPAAGAELSVTAGLWIVGFELWNPEGFVAGANLDREIAADVTPTADPTRLRNRVVLDERYLVNELGLDAVPVIAERLERLDPETAARLREGLCRSHPGDDRYGPLGRSRSASRARAAIDELNCGT